MNIALAKQCAGGGIFYAAVGIGCLASNGAGDSLKRLKALNRFKKEILGEESFCKVKRDNILDKAIEKFGELQLVKASEECCELAQALNKYYVKYELTKKQQLQSKHFYMKEEENVKEEIADVEIMLLQVKKILEIKEEDLEEIKHQKLERLEKALESVYEEHK